MIRGIGVDTVDIERFSRQLASAPALRARLFAPVERSLAVPSLAARFAAKEALVKALRGSWNLGWQDLVIERDENRAPGFAATPGLAGCLLELGIARPHLSMTHDGGFATAFVVVEERAGGEVDA